MSYKKRIGIRPAVLIAAGLFLTGLTGCGPSADIIEKMNSAEDLVQNVSAAKDTVLAEESEESGFSGEIDGLPNGFPEEIPIYDGAQILDADSFNGNHYTVLFMTGDSFENVVNYYTEQFALDGTGTGDGEAYYEGIPYGEIMIKGLTIENTGDAVNVYMTLEDGVQAEEIEAEDAVYDSEAEYDGGNSGNMTYENAQEVLLESNYPIELVPLPQGAKVTESSMIPGCSSGFVDLIMPAAEFEDAVDFYTELGLNAKLMKTDIQETASFNGEIENLSVDVLVSHLMSAGNDTWIQITVNEND